MTTVDVTEVRDNLDKYLELVKNGEEVVITDAGVAVARINPAKRETDEEKLTRLEKAGVIRRGTGGIAQWLIDNPPIKLPEGVSVLEALLEERRSSNR